LTLSVPDEGYSNLSPLRVPDEGYSNLSPLRVPDEGYSNLSPLRVPDEGRLLLGLCYTTLKCFYDVNLILIGLSSVAL
jgi:hypothetical protein